MAITTAGLAARITGASVRRPGLTALASLLLLGALGSQLLRLEKEVGYAAFFGPDDAGVTRLTAFLEEFDSGVHAVVAFGCQTPDVCTRVTERRVLELLGRLQRAVERLPNVRRTWSLLNTPILVGPLETRTIASRTSTGAFELAADWRELVARAPSEPFLTDSVISEDARTLGLIVEFQSVASGPLQDLVHGILDLLRRFEKDLGTEIFVAGDPVWSVMMNDDLDRDSNRLSALMVLVMLAVLFGLFRDLRLALAPLLAIAALALSIQGSIAAFGIPMTTMMAALPPLLVVIATASVMHLLSAYLRNPAPRAADALVAAAAEVGSGCFWAAATTAAGFGSFLLSDLPVFEHFGLMAALGVAVAYLVTFSTIPALLLLSGDHRARVAASRRSAPVSELLALFRDTAASHPRSVLWSASLLMLFLASGVHALKYEADFGFGEQHFVMRSVRFIEANLRKPMTTELVLSIPDGTRIYDPEPLRILRRLEEYFEGEASTGRVWSFLDFAEEAYRVDHGAPPPDLETLLKAVPNEMPLVAGMERVGAFWSEHVAAASDRRARDRARVSVDRAWLDDAAQAPYLRRLRRFQSELNQELESRAYRVELEGPLVLADRFVEKIRDTQWKSFAGAFLVVAITLGALLCRSPRLAALAIVVNLAPVSSLLGLMGWAGIGVDPANAMVGAILLAIAVDDTIHVTLRLRRERSRQPHLGRSVLATVDAVGEPVIISSLCLSLGFSVLMFSSWGGLTSFGLLASLGILFVLAADLLVLPAFLLRSEPLHREALEPDAAS